MFRFIWYPLLLGMTVVFYTSEYTASFDPWPMWQRILLIALLWGITIIAEIVAYILYESDVEKRCIDKTVEQLTTIYSVVIGFTDKVYLAKITLEKYGNKNTWFFRVNFSYNREISQRMINELNSFSEFNNLWYGDSEELSVPVSIPQSLSVWSKIKNEHPLWNVKRDGLSIKIIL